MKKAIAITGIHTGIGKTIVSAILAEALDADYWKPVQAGNLDNSDSIIVKNLLSNGDQRVHKEAVLLREPMSPHSAAKIDNIVIDHTRFKWPDTEKTIIIETAGGVLSPMSDDVTMADFVQYYKLPSLLVASNYLGSINHTLLSIEALKSRGINILGIVMNGMKNESSETYIERYGKVPVITRIPQFGVLNREAIKQCANEIKRSLLEKMSYGGY